MEVEADGPCFDPNEKNKIVNTRSITDPDDKNESNDDDEYRLQHKIIFEDVEYLDYDVIDGPSKNTIEDERNVTQENVSSDDESSYTIKEKIKFEDASFPNSNETDSPLQSNDPARDTTVNIEECDGPPIPAQKKGSLKKLSTIPLNMSDDFGKNSSKKVKKGPMKLEEKKPIANADYAVDPANLPENAYGNIKKPRGILQIFNIHKFDSNNKWFEERTTSAADAKYLMNVFADVLGFHVLTYDNPTTKNVKTILARTNSLIDEKTKPNCFVFAFLSYGDIDKVYTKDGFIEMKEITKHFKDKFYAGIVKFFICPTKKPLIKSLVESDSEPTGMVKKPQYWLPVDADFIYVHSVSEDFSKFISAFCEVLKKEAERVDLARMLQHVNQKDEKLMAFFIIQLRKEYYFFPPKPKGKDQTDYRKEKSHSLLRKRFNCTVI